MKLRQKLAMVLATAMVVTAVPVVTMADTSNSVNTDINIVAGEKVETFVTLTMKNNYNTATQGKTVNVNSPSVKQAVMAGATFKAEVNHIVKDAKLALQQDGDKYVMWKTVNTETTGGAIVESKLYFNGTTWRSDITVEDRALNAAGEAKLEAAVGKELSAAYDTAVKATGTNTIKTAAEAEVVKQNADINTNGKNNSITSIEITNAEFDKTAYPQTITVAGNTAVTAKVEWISKTELRVTVQGKLIREDQINVPLNFTAKEGEIKLTIDGTDAAVSDSTHIITEKSTKYMTSITTGDTKTVSEKGGQIADITLTESMINALDDMKGNIKIELPGNSDLEFVAGKASVTGKKAYAGITTDKVDTDGNAIKYTVPVFLDKEDKDNQTLIINVQEIKDIFTKEGVNSIGSLTFSGITVKPQDRKDVKFGDVEVSISSTIKEDKNTTKIETEFETVKAVKVATVATYDVALTCAKPVEVVAGKEAQEVSFNLTEAIEGSLHTNKLVDFTLDNGFFGIVDPSAADAEAKAIELLGNVLKKDAKGDLVKEVSFYDVEIQKDGRVTGFTLDVSKLDAKKAQDLFFTVEVQAPVSFTGDINLLVKDGGVDHKDLTAKLATVTAPFTIKTEAMNAKVGLNGQTGGKITITEATAGMIEKGELVLELKDNKGIKIANDDFKIEATNLKVEVDKVEGGRITLDVTRTSNKEAGSLVISDIVFDVDRTVPEGSFDLAVSGTSLSEVTTYNKEDAANKPSKVDNIVIDDFVVVGTPNTEDIVNGMKKGTASFAIGATKYTVNGEEKEMDATPYVTAKNRTMMPLRYVSEAFGIEGNNIIFTKADGTITILAGTRTLQLTNGSDIATLNGVAIKMDEKVTIKAGRTYVPVGEIGRLLGVSVNWDDATKTATFTNK